MAKRLSSKGYAAYVLAPAAGAAVGVPRPHRPLQDPPRSRRDGRPAGEGRAVQALGHSLSRLALDYPRPPFRAFCSRSASPALDIRRRLDCARAAAPRARPDPSLDALPSGLSTGAVYFAGHSLLDHARDGAARRPSVWVAVLVNARSSPIFSLFPAIFAVVVRRLVAQFGAARADGRAAGVGRDRVWDARYLFTGFPWVLLGYSQTTVLPSRSWRVCSASTASRRSSRA